MEFSFFFLLFFQFALTCLIQVRLGPLAFILVLILRNEFCRIFKVTEKLSKIGNAGAHPKMSKGTSKSSTPLHSKTSHVVTSHSHEWLIEDFVRREESTGSSLQTRFSVMVSDNKNTQSETVWRIKLYPKGCDADHSSYVSIFINQVTGPTVWVKYAISLLGCQNFDRTPYGMFDIKVFINQTL